MAHIYGRGEVDRKKTAITHNFSLFFPFFPLGLGWNRESCQTLLSPKKTACQVADCPFQKSEKTANKENNIHNNM